MNNQGQSLLFDVPATGVKVKPRRTAVLPPVDIKPIQEKWNRLSPELKRLVPEPLKINDVRDFWLTPNQIGAFCGGLIDDSIITRMYEGRGFGNCHDVGIDPDQPYFRILLEDAIDFLLNTKIGADDVGKV